MIIFNGRPVNPFSSVLFFLVLIGLGWLLLPLLGGLLLIFLLVIAGFVLYGLYWKWRYGDPVKKMREEFMRTMNGDATAQNDTYASPEPPKDATKATRVRAGIKRTQTVEDAVIVDEVSRK